MLATLLVCWLAWWLHQNLRSLICALAGRTQQQIPKPRQCSTLAAIIELLLNSNFKEINWHDFLLFRKVKYVTYTVYSFCNNSFHIFNNRLSLWSKKKTKAINNLKLNNVLKNIFYSNKFIDWVCRILISLNILMPGINYSDHFYPLDVLIITVVSFWLYISRLKVFCLLLLLFALFINYQHLGKGPGE